MKRDVRYASLLGLVIGVFFMSLFVTLSGDDFFYAEFSQNGIGHFLMSHIEHYIHSNGRCIVHILDSIFLYLPHIVWKVINPLMWAAIAINIYRLINIYEKDKSKLKFTMFLLCGGFLTLHIELAKESTLWITGSFNYTYPLMMFVWYWYLLFTSEKHSSKKLCIVGFLAAASMEQESLLTLLLTAGFILYTVYEKKEKPDKKLKHALISVIIGVISLFLAPGNIGRMGDELGRSSGTLSSIISGIDFMLNYCISSDYMVYLNIVLMTVCALYLYKNSSKLALYLLPLEIMMLLITNHSGEFAWMKAAFYIIYYVSRIYYFVVLFKAANLYNKTESCPMPLLCALFAVFSCGAIVFSPTLGPRVLLFAAIMAVVICVMLMSKMLKKQTYFYAIIHIVVLSLSVVNVIYITHGFYKNSVVFKENEQLVEEWRNSDGEELVQKQYRNDKFEHSMPYNSEYHEVKYKVYYGIGLDTEIKWK